MARAAVERAISGEVGQTVEDPLLRSSFRNPQWQVVTPMKLDWKRTVEWLKAVDAIRKAGLLQVA